MPWYYPETRPQRLPLTTPVRPATSGGTGGPPTGPAGGDLAGTYPAPTLAPGAVGTTDVVDGAITDAKITSVAYAKVTGAPAIPTTLPPSGPAGGDLTGTYPAPTIGAGKVTNAAVATGIDAAKITTGTLPVAQVPNLDAAKITTGTLVQARLPVSPSGLLTANLNDSQVTDAKIVGMAYSKLTGAPTSLPPSGTAGGDLSGTYPNPQLGAGVVVDGDISATAAIQGTKFADAPNGIPTAKLNDLAVTDAKIAGVAYSKVTGTPTALPPSGAASGDLGGTYPGPTIAKLNGATVGTTTPLARGDLLVANATPALVRLARGTVNQVLQSDGTDVVWGPAPATGGPPTGTAGGSLAGSYPNPTIAASAIRGTPSAGGTAREIAKASIWGADDLIDASVSDAKIAGVAYAKVTGHPTSYPPSGAASGDLSGTYPGPTIAAASVTSSKLAVGATVPATGFVAFPVSYSYNTDSTESAAIVTVAITTRGGRVVAYVFPSFAVNYGTSVSCIVLVNLKRDGTLLYSQRYDIGGPSGGTKVTPLGGFVWVDSAATAAAHSYTVTVNVYGNPAGTAFVQTQTNNPGHVTLLELA